MSRFALRAAAIALMFTVIPLRTLGISHEVSSGTTGAISFGPFTQIDAQAGYRYLYSPTVQIGFDASYNYLKAQNALNGSSTLLGMASLSLNFPGNQGLIDAFYITAMAGFNFQSYANVAPPFDTRTDFAFAGAVGKRFPITANITYRPSASVLKVSNYEARFILTPLAFSALFD